MEYKLTNDEVAEITARGGDVVEAQEAKKKAWLKANPQLNIYLTPEEIMKLNEKMGLALPAYVTEEEKVVAKASADNAVKIIIDWLKKHNDFYPSCAESGAGLLLTIRDYKELKKLTEVGNERDKV